MAKTKPIRQKTIQKRKDDEALGIMKALESRIKKGELTVYTSGAWSVNDELQFRLILKIPNESKRS